MSFLVKQKMKSGAVYLYEAEGYWDKDKKQTRQRRRYVGKIDPESGKVETPRKSLSIKASLDFGVWHLFESIDDSAKLLSSLAEEFGESATDIFRLAVYQASEGKPMNLYKDWSESTSGPQGSFHTSQDISRLLEAIGENSRGRERFLAAWTKRICKKGKAVLFDVTSVSAFGDCCDMFEWGYNRDHEKLHQINMGVALDVESGLPLLYRAYPGSVADVSMIRKLVQDMEAMGLEALRMVLDRGFYSLRNLLAMKEAGIHFLIPMPAGVKHAEGLLEDAKKALSSPLSAFRLGGTSVFATSRSLNAGGIRLEAQVFLDETRRASELDHFIRRITDVEDAAAEEKSKFDTAETFREKVAQRFPGMERYFSFAKARGRIVATRDAKAMEERISKMGRMILVSDEKARTPRESLALYRDKDAVEKFFDSLKNTADGNRVRAHSEEVMQGRLFVMFCAVILHSALQTRLAKTDLASSISTPAVFSCLKKLRQVEMSNGKSRLTELTREQRNLFEKLDVPIPV